MNAKTWIIDPQFHSLRHAASQGVLISEGPLNVMHRVLWKDREFYIKQYWRAGKGLRRWLSRSRARGEWENLLFFQSLGIPVPPLLGFEETIARIFVPYSALLITAAIPNAIDLITLKNQHPEYLNDRTRVRIVLRKLAEYVRRLHQSGFVHRDLKWRNLLITLYTEPEIYFIDCPLGRRKRWGYRNGQEKDLWHLYREAKGYLSKSTLLYFYLQYRGIAKLTPTEKKRLRAFQKRFNISAHLR